MDGVVVNGVKRMGRESGAKREGDHDWKCSLEMGVDEGVRRRLWVKREWH